ncbi:3-keto-disaccharide hydrolase [Flavitalea antarctica]
MKLITIVFFLATVYCCSTAKKTTAKDGWIPLFDGKTLSGWRVNENDSTFSIENGAIKVNGRISHIFYEGPVMNHNFKNFEFKARVMTTPGSNSGIYFHTAFKPKGFPSKGYEVQVNNSHTDWRRTGSLYAVQDVRKTYVRDDEWYTEYIKVQGKNITIKINDSTVVEYTEPDGIENTKGRAEKRLGNGTFALQGHDPKSKVYYKDIFVKPLPD